MEDGKMRRYDVIHSAFSRLYEKGGVSRPIKVFRKTAASKLAEQKDYKYYVNYFLGTAPRLSQTGTTSLLPMRNFLKHWTGSEASSYRPAILVLSHSPGSHRNCPTTDLGNTPCFPGITTRQQGNTALLNFSEHSKQRR